MTGIYALACGAQPTVGNREGLDGIYHCIFFIQLKESGLINIPIF